MSTQGISCHVRSGAGDEVAAALAALGLPSAVLASNRRWTSFVPLGAPAVDLATVAWGVAAPALHVWFDEDSAVDVHVVTPDGWQAELSVALDGSYELGRQDESLIAALVERNLITVGAAAALRAGLGQPRGACEAWVRGHGIEAALGLPFVEPLPLPCTQDMARERAPAATIVVAAAAAGRAGSEPATAAAAAARAWSSAERATIELHFFYLTELWSMNDWKLYNRYKKHLPAERRREVDGLVNLMMTGASDVELRGALEAILAAVWDADDWDAVIRDPRLVADEPLEPAQRADWQRRLAAGPG